MADPRFFTVGPPLSLARLAEIAEAELRPPEAADRTIEDVAPLDAAGPTHITFLDNRRYVDALTQSRAAACILHPSLAAKAPAGMALVLSASPYHAYARVAQAFYSGAVQDTEAPPAIAPSATVDPTARIGNGSAVDAGAVIEAGVQIGERCRVGANAVIGRNVVIGDGTVVGACSSLSHCLVGADVLIHPGVRIGQDGFGFAPDPKGHVKVPQLGRVLIEDDVEIGANTTIDRGSGPDTVIGRGCRIDNLVQIGHNVRLGRGCVVVAQVGISGSTKLDDFVMIGGQAGLGGHLHIGSGARIAARSGVKDDVPAGQTVGGSPALPAGEWRRQMAVLARLAKPKSR